ncbi:alpha/beta hydrolase [Fulvivirga sp. RKSG066]|uniref:alpha/beta hydrolase n=1 Tax=Fulvivirga aurantia TaxID=2529383 RepID=UPI0012BC4CC7|nr:alpha/beta hydrolase [Fulvivirga aurantia]MTI22848.1 alpha/beta hydrolase [Fulvivirga aurantia]
MTANKQLQISTDSYRLNYNVYGSGNQIFLAFHGFGQDASAFNIIANKLSETHMIISVDLFFHGNSYWPAGDTLSKKQWTEIVDRLLEANKVDRFSLLAFSMGGKFALSIAESFAPKIDQLILLAPDGIKTSMWYSLATYPYVFRSYFRSMIVKPKRFYNILNLFKQLGVVDKGISKFALSQMNSKKKRRRVFYSWVTFKDFTFDMNMIAQNINEHSINLIMILGKYDKIITHKGMKRLLDKLPNHDAHIISSGHNDLIKNVAETPELIDKF